MRSFASTSRPLIVVEVVVVEDDDVAFVVVEVVEVVVGEPGKVGSTKPSSGNDVEVGVPAFSVPRSLSLSPRNATTNPATSRVKARMVAAMN